MDKLILRFESAVIRDVPITGTTTSIGRKPDNDLVIDHPAVSGHHCKIIKQGDKFFIEDLDSTNGTILNGTKVIKAAIHHQDTITIAKHSVTLLLSPTKNVQTPQQPTTPPPQPKETRSETKVGKKKHDKVGGVKILEGIVDKSEYELPDTSLYIGKSSRVTIKIKGMMAPEVAAMFCRKGESYVIVPIKEGYPKVNGLALNQERILNDGDTIEVGSTKMQFFTRPL